MDERRGTAKIKGGQDSWELGKRGREEERKEKPFPHFYSFTIYPRVKTKFHCPTF